ncbi:uncharacterized protein HMPREF1541_03350 [Cyphellophora europaea CBS 101466]|uniref:TFIIS N-terminal domain-containing protein n=1 Tax=Cyphellophora europaea (strain CBS 101466) TaxID=1220924 RepID=W2RYL9_CYPE1|nr:uncharacterized protein HMPREF1541_03350 [Cyphellophora europaea CBS 101466]ETN41415.1 hypothetical protein HMPREF1541_03350 [Cyphellophora europaea CBS 101466]
MREKEVFFLRHKLQRGFLMPNHPPKLEDMSEMSRCLERLEDYRDLDAAIIHTTKVHKVLKGLLKLDWIPKDEEFDISSRSKSLLDRWKQRQNGPVDIGDHDNAEDTTAADTTTERAIDAPQEQPAPIAEPERAGRRRFWQTLRDIVDSESESSSDDEAEKTPNKPTKTSASGGPRRGTRSAGKSVDRPSRIVSFKSDRLRQSLPLPARPRLSTDHGSPSRDFEPPAGEEFTLPEDLPSHLRELLENDSLLQKEKNDIYLDKQGVEHSPKVPYLPFVYTLTRTGERLTVRFYRCFSTPTRQLGVCVAVGASFPEPTILGRSPGKAKNYFRPWHGSVKAFADETWEVWKRLDGPKKRRKRRKPVVGARKRARVTDKEDSLADTMDKVQREDSIMLSEEESLDDSQLRNHAEPLGQNQHQASSDDTGSLVEVQQTSSSFPRVKAEAIYPSPAGSRLAQFTPQHGEDVKGLEVDFIDETDTTVRRRAWSECNSSRKLFTQAVVARLLQSGRDVAALSVRIADLEIPLMMGDELDFQEVEDAVAHQVTLAQQSPSDAVGKIEVRLL